MQSMEIAGGASKEEEESKCSFCSKTRLLVLMGSIFLVAATLQFVMPEGEVKDEDFGKVVEKKKKNLVPKVKKGERYPYEPDHWCLNNKVMTDMAKELCEEACENPLAPRVQMHYMAEWTATHRKYIDIVNDAPDDLDVVFYGDQAIEGFVGTRIGLEDEKLAEGPKIFKSLFSVADGGDFNGLALGIADDRSNHLLYRLQGGELPDNINPKVFWLEIGTNNFRTEYCAAEVVARGVTRIAEELMEKRPHSKIVLNGLLPRADHSLTGLLTANYEINGEELLTIWDGIKSVNEILQEFAKKHKNVYYVDSGDLFLEEIDDRKDGETRMFIRQDLMENYQDITIEGYRKWGESIVENLHEILS